MPRSDLHCVCVRIDTGCTNQAVKSVTDGTEAVAPLPPPWSIFCFECNEELYIDSYKKLRNAVDFVKVVAGKKPAVTAGTKATAAPVKTTGVVNKSGVIVRSGGI